ncbi:hypothetical protein QCA50_008809 [Cerrena zonata]|uniref:Uncharacterized protein n=1 Tax=Cerrena zonata TaxID=2478898 RepID=A0AAW0GEY9_9APHY
MAMLTSRDLIFAVHSPGLITTPCYYSTALTSYTQRPPTSSIYPVRNTTTTGTLLFSTSPRYDNILPPLSPLSSPPNHTSASVCLIYYSWRILPSHLSTLFNPIVDLFGRNPKC